jgi:hypothetical protein
MPQARQRVRRRRRGKQVAGRSEWRMGDSGAKGGATDCAQITRMVATDSMLTLATISGILLATAAAIRAFRSVENQSLLAIVAGKALWDEVNPFKKKLFATAISQPQPHAYDLRLCHYADSYARFDGVTNE